MKPKKPTKPTRKPKVAQPKPPVLAPSAPAVDAPAAPAASTPLRGYERFREAKANEFRAMSARGRDIGSIPPCANPERRSEAETSLRRWCEVYFAQTFPLAWSDPHIRALSRIDEAVTVGGLFAFAMPRGTGKTTMCEVGGMYAVATGRRDFIALIGATEEHAERMLSNLKVEFATNELLAEDYPEICIPIERLEGIAQRANGQLCCGKPTHIRWEAKSIVLPTIVGSKASGAIIRCAGLTGAIRGMSAKRADGRRVRPNLAIIDDPQTDESANSPSQCRTREGLLAGAILGLAGPGQKIAAVMPCTVIRAGDMADAILDREKHPEWRGERSKMVVEWPTNTTLWDEYAALRRQSFRDGGRGETATEFYRANKAAMDAGGVVSWEARHDPDELSALQHAMNLRIDRKDAAFFAEFQNEPIPLVTASASELEQDEAAGKVSGYARGLVPRDASALTMSIDIQQSVLFWTVAAWSEDFTGWVVDYGAWPDQKMRYYTLGEVKKTLSDAAPKAGLEGSIHHGLERLLEERADRVWKQDGGGTVRLDRVLIDANWGQSTDVVYQFCARSRWNGLALPSHGRFVGASSAPWGSTAKKKGEKAGSHWRMPPATERRAVRHVLFDSNWWKSFVHERFGVPLGDPGSVSLFEGDRELHRMFAEHLTAEHRIAVSAKGRTVDEWRLRRPGLDNHWLDCMVGCAVGASMSGCSLPSMREAVVERKPRVKLSDIKRGPR